MQAADADVLRACDVGGMEDQVLTILAAAQRRSLAELAAEQRAPDGGIMIDSMSAVFVCSIINRTLGGGVLWRLAGASQPADFVSTRALATCYTGCARIGLHDEIIDPTTDDLVRVGGRAACDD